MFTIEETDAIAIGVRLLRRLRDPKLEAAAQSVLAKLAAVVPQELQPQLVAAPLYVSEGSAPAVTGIDLSQLRNAIRETRKLAITYANEEGRRTERTIWPIAMAYYVDVTLVGAWCELRDDFRHFRVDRILTSQLLDERFSSDSGRLTAEWLALRKDRANAAACSAQPGAAELGKLRCHTAAKFGCASARTAIACSRPQFSANQARRGRHRVMVAI
jgi:predicted DNA-binding transcriptional regulator YafY